jgi:PAS domain S-box-containing protein
MNGFEVCRRLKARRESRDIPLMFISAITETEERVEGLRLGAVDFVSKPFRKEELLARIETHLELSRLRERLEQQVAERTAKLKAANEQLRAELAERIRAEQALRESEARFRNMADTASVCIWTSGPDTKLNFCNKYGLTFCGRTLEELVGYGWKEVVHPEDLEFKYPDYVPIIESHREYRVEYRIRRADGEYRWMLDSATPRFLANGDFAGYVGVMLDITDLKRNQEQYLAAQKLESLGVLVAGVAHNFNNQMGTILAEADLALSDLPPDSPAYGNVERINAVAIRASGVVALLMAYAGSGATGAPTPVSLSEVVAETVRLFKVTVPKKVEFSNNLAGNLPAVRADVSQIRQVVMNLLTNASESLRNQEGTIRLTTSCVHLEDAAAVDGTGLPPGNYVRLEVTDTGCGIAEEALNKLFDPFYSTKLFGRGLGLAAVQGIVRSLRGAVKVRSTPGRGSTFEILLPGCDEALLM